VVKASEEFEVKNTRDEAWAFFSDLAKIGSCIPGCESIEMLDSDNAIFKVKVRVGYVSRTFEMKARLVRRQKPSEIVFEAEGSDGKINGEITIDAPVANSTRIKYALEISAASVIGRTALSMMGKELIRKQTREFASCVESKLNA
jgi:carbon monoxide dehydrogenase subunit G